jgi:hypothetical protein
MKKNLSLALTIVSASVVPLLQARIPSPSQSMVTGTDDPTFGHYGWLETLLLSFLEYLKGEILSYN